MTGNGVNRELKTELAPAEERTEAGRLYSPRTDIYDTADAVVVAMDMPGVAREAVDIRLEEDVLSVTGKVDSKRYDGLDPLYTEHDVSTFVRSFRLSADIDRERVSAKLEDGVLTVTLPKASAAAARRIRVH